MSRETLSVDLHFKPSSLTKNSTFCDQKTAKELPTFQSEFIFRLYMPLFACEAPYLVYMSMKKVIVTDEKIFSVYKALDRER